MLYLVSNYMKQAYIFHAMLAGIVRRCVANILIIAFSVHIIPFLKSSLTNKVRLCER